MTWSVAAVRAADEKHVWHPWSPITPERERLLLTRGEGCRVFDAEGRAYLDLRAGTLNASVGYAHPRVVRALTGQAGRLMTWDLAEAATAPAALLAERLAGLLPAGLGRTLWVNSGSEATEAAVKIARMWHRLNGRPQRTVICSFADGYHGATTAAVAATASPFRRDGAGPLPDGYAHLTTPRCAGCTEGTGHGVCRVPGRAVWEEQLLALGPESVAAVLVEPVLGVGGVTIPPTGALRDLRELCDRYGILLIVDEVATGFGRTGRWFGFQHDLDGDGGGPDVVLCAKGLTGGYAPLAGVTVREGIYEAFAGDGLLGGLRHGHTTGGHATACAAGLAVLDVIEENRLVATAAGLGARLLEVLGTLVGRPGVRAVR
ncbi:aminotransferase family protein, partial [Streptomyces clavuligerus]